MEGGVGGQDNALAEVAEFFPGLALEGVAFDDGGEEFDRIVDGDAGRDEAV
jgi:hypothetical protein